MSAVAPIGHLQEIRMLVGRLEKEHRAFASDIGGLEEKVQADEVGMVRKLFVQLQDSLTDHMLVEEFEVYPELMRKNLFDASISSIMQQHHDVTSSLGKMELSLRLGNFIEFQAVLEELARVLRKHQPAEEEKVFPLATV
ncbi:MAG: hemerythrin domain-containing protein [Nitrososphaerota archaeon]|nr:hemerythrin domain-containing protein [Nitrososphaerota archaeon]